MSFQIKSLKYQHSCMSFPVLESLTLSSDIFRTNPGLSWRGPQALPHKASQGSGLWSGAAEVPRALFQRPSGVHSSLPQSEPL